jgi:DNA-directed RNA polymerase subunit omega
MLDSVNGGLYHILFQQAKPAPGVFHARPFTKGRAVLFIKTNCGGKSFAPVSGPGRAHYGGSMARITVEDCQERVDNRFLLVQMAIKRVHQYREGYEPLVESRNKEVVTALREIAAGKVLPDDDSLYNPLAEEQAAPASGE